MNSGSASALESEHEASLDGPPVQDAPVGVSRHEKSLGLLTSRFVTLLQSAEDGILDLKAVSFYHVLTLQSLSGSHSLSVSHRH